MSIARRRGRRVAARERSGYEIQYESTMSWPAAAEWRTLPGMDGEGRSVLVVDDDEALRGLVVELLRDEGYRVEAVRDGRAALHAIARWSPDVILLDRCMPDMDGEEFARVYRALPPPHAPIVLLTGHTQAEAAGERVGAAAVVVKPFDLDDLLTTVDWVIQESASDSSLVPVGPRSSAKSSLPVS
jgi:CheY-like chemotaxis protein